MNNRDWYRLMEADSEHEYIDSPIWKLKGFLVCSPTDSFAVVDEEGEGVTPLPDFVTREDDVHLFIDWMNSAHAEGAKAGRRELRRQLKRLLEGEG